MFYLTRLSEVKSPLLIRYWEIVASLVSSISFHFCCLDLLCAVVLHVQIGNNDSPFDFPLGDMARNLAIQCHAVASSAVNGVRISARVT